MGRCGDGNNINIFSRHQLSKIIVGVTILVAIVLVDQTTCPASLVGVDVANRNDLRVFSAHESPHVTGASATRSNTADGNPVTWCDTAIFTQCCRANKARKTYNTCTSQRSPFQELTPVYFSFSHNYSSRAFLNHCSNHWISESLQSTSIVLWLRARATVRRYRRGLDQLQWQDVSSPLGASGCYFFVPSDCLTTVTSIASRLAQGRSMSNHSVVLLYFARTCFR